MRKSIFLYAACVIIFYFGTIAFAAEVIDIDIGNLDDPRIVLEELKVKVNKAFNQVETELSAAAQELSATGISGPAAKAILDKLYNGKEFLVDCTTISPDGRIVAITPDNFKDQEGKDISGQEHIGRLIRTKKPTFSDVFLSVEGFNAVDFQYPVFSPGNEFLGSVNLLIKYEGLFSPIVLPIVQGGPFDVWIIQKNGLTLYDPDKEEIGRNVFEDPLYKPFPSYVELCRRIVKEESGFGSYNFLNKGLGKPINKDAAWATIGMYGVEWRMVVVRERRTIGG